MQLTPGQLRKIVHLSTETYRHWKLVLPAFRGRKGRSCAFTAGDAVALMVLRSLTSEWGVQIGSLRTLSEEIFRVCRSTSWMALESAILQVSVAEGSCKLLSAPSLNGNGPVLLYPLRPIMEQLREEFFRTEVQSTQHELPLPPTPILDQKPSKRRA